MATPSLFPVFMKAASGNGVDGLIVETGLIDAIVASNILASISEDSISLNLDNALNVSVSGSGISTSLSGPIVVDVSPNQISVEVC